MKIRFDEEDDVTSCPGCGVASEQSFCGRDEHSTGVNFRINQINSDFHYIKCIYSVLYSYTQCNVDLE